MRQGAEVIWSAPQTGPATKVRLQGDGNLVARGAGEVSMWSTGTAGKNGSTLRVEDNGTVVMRQNGVVVWSIGPFM